MKKRLAYAAALILLTPGGVAAVPSEREPTWVQSLAGAVSRIDDQTDGNLGVFIKRLDDGSTFSYQGDRSWYLASTTKVPVAIALLQKVEEGELALTDKVILKESDYVDGGGRLLWTQPGAEFTFGQLLERMLTESDSTAADMLIRKIGERELNERLSEMAGDGFGPLTTILQVRADAYSEIHPGARGLSNMDFIILAGKSSYDARYQALLDEIGIAEEEATLGSVEEAFEAYYARGRNSGTLTGYGALLERLAEGELLSKAHTALVLEHMEKMTTGEHRIKAGLPSGVRFAQKTGTQLRRVCNMGIVTSEDEVGEPVVICACMEKFADREVAEAALGHLGASIATSGALEP